MADLAFQYTHTSSQACFLFNHKVQTVKPNTTLHLITNSNLPFNFTSHSVMGVCSMLSQESSSEVLETPLSNVWHFKQILTFWLFRLSNGCLSSTGDSADLWLKFVSRGYSKLATCKKQSTPTALTAGTHTHRELTNCPPVAQTVAEATHTQQIFYYPSLLKTRALRVSWQPSSQKELWEFVSPGLLSVCVRVYPFYSQIRHRSEHNVCESEVQQRHIQQHDSHKDSTATDNKRKILTWTWTKIKYTQNSFTASFKCLLEGILQVNCCYAHTDAHTHTQRTKYLRDLFNSNKSIARMVESIKQ